MGKHVVVGSGPVGTWTARQLADREQEVVLVSRSGAGPELDGVRRVALDVSDADALTELAEDAEALYNCVNPPSYDVWPTWWPPVAAAFLVAAERTGAVLVTASSLYGYGPVEAPMVEGQPDAATDRKGRLRAGMWAEARAAHEAGRLRAVEVRGSDYVGPGVTQAHVPMAMARVVKGRTAWVFGRTDTTHSFTDVRDMARTLVAVAADPTTHGHVWHAPTNPPRTQAEAVADVCRAGGLRPTRVRAMPRLLFTLGGKVVPMLREMGDMLYEFERPYVLDSSVSEARLGLAPTPWDEVCRATAASAVGTDGATDDATGGAKDGDPVDAASAVQRPARA